MLLPDLSAAIHTLVVGVLTYAAVLLLLRAFGKRSLAKWNAFDFVVTIAFGSVLARPSLRATSPPAARPLPSVS